jgi:hypothetical protein
MAGKIGSSKQGMSPTNFQVEKDFVKKMLVKS